MHILINGWFWRGQSTTGSELLAKPTNPMAIFLDNHKTALNIFLGMERQKSFQFYVNIRYSLRCDTQKNYATVRKHSGKDEGAKIFIPRDENAVVGSSEL